MKRVCLVTCAAVLILALCPGISEARIQREPGGFPAFLIGCCLGLREGTQWNEGSVLHWREWSTLIPVVGIGFAVWNGVECAQGKRAHEWATDHGADWY